MCTPNEMFVSITNRMRFHSADVSSLFQSKATIIHARHLINNSNIGPFCNISVDQISLFLVSFSLYLSPFSHRRSQQRKSARINRLNCFKEFFLINTVITSKSPFCLETGWRPAHEVQHIVSRPNRGPP